MLLRNIFLARQKINIVALTVASICLMGLSSCGDKSITVLAKVNDEPITDVDVNFMIERSFDRAYITGADAGLQQKILDSLIASRAMKQLVLKELSQEEIAKIKNLSKAYEEELYVKEYLQKHVTPEPVTAEMVQEYYTKHPEEFGAEAVRDFELLKAPENLDEQLRDQLLKKINTIRNTTNWAGSASAWQQELRLQFQQGRSKAGLLNKSLEQKIAALKKGETSDVFYIDGELYLVRVTNIVQAAPKSLPEVSGDIRKRLAPLMLRNAVKKASENARSKTKVVVTATKNK